MEQRIEATNELAENAATLKDLKDADALKKGNARAKELNEKLAKLKADFEKQPKDQQEAAIRKHGLALTQAEGKLAASVGGAVFGGLKDLGNDVKKDIGDVGKDLKKDINDTGKDFGKDFPKGPPKDFDKDFPKDFNKDFPKDFNKDFPKR